MSIIRRPYHGLGERQHCPKGLQNDWLGQDRSCYKANVKLASPVAFVLVLAAVIGAPAQTPLPAHSHNDYQRAKPLIEALEAGFRSIEVDVHLKDGKLLVGHDPEDLQLGRTIEKEYLRPLQEYARERGGKIFGEGGPLLLLVDFKTEAVATYQALEKILPQYQDILTRVEGDRIIVMGAVNIIISGNRPRELMLSRKSRLAAFDGRLPDLGAGLPREFMPLVSDNWQNHFKWRGLGEFPETERAKLKELVQKAHAEGKLIRFWASPDHPAAWQEQKNAGVDLINTDKVPEMAAFLRGQSVPAP